MPMPCPLKFKAENTIFDLDWRKDQVQFIIVYTTIARPDSTYRSRCEVVERSVSVLCLEGNSVTFENCRRHRSKHQRALKTRQWQETRAASPPIYLIFIAFTDAVQCFSSDDLNGVVFAWCKP
jgi:hypothetical protein